MESKNILLNIKSKYIIDIIFEYAKKIQLKYQLFKHNKSLLKKFQIGINEFQEISILVKYYNIFSMKNPEEIINFKNNIQAKIKLIYPDFEEIFKKFLMNNLINQINKLNNEYEYLIIENDLISNYLIDNNIILDKLYIIINENNKTNNNINNYIKNIIDSNEKMYLMFEIKDLLFYNIFNIKRLGCIYEEIFDLIKTNNFKNLIEFEYSGNFTTSQFNESINNLINLQNLFLSNNTNSFNIKLKLTNLIYLSINNCPNGKFIIENENILKNIKYLDFEDESIFEFSFLKENEKVKFPNLEYLYFTENIIDFKNSHKIKYLKENKIELIKNKINFYTNLLTYNNIQKINLDVYQLNKINPDDFNKFINTLNNLLNLKSLIISSSFNDDVIKNILISSNIIKSLKSININIENLDIFDYVIENYKELTNLEINIGKKIAKIRINTPKPLFIKELNEYLNKQYSSFKKETNCLEIKENNQYKINSININNSNFCILNKTIYCHSFNSLIELKLKNVSINTLLFPLFNKNCNIILNNLKILNIKILSYIDTFYQLEFKKNTLKDALGNNVNPFDLDMNLVELEALINLSNNIDKIPKIQEFVFICKVPNINSAIIKNILNNIFDLKYLYLLDFLISKTDKTKILKENKIYQLFPKVKNNLNKSIIKRFNIVDFENF